MHSLLRPLIDALDECSNPAEVLCVLDQSRQRGARIRMLVTSRDESDIRNAFEKYGTPRIRLEEYSDDLNWDIRYYIDDRLQREPKLQWFNSSTKYQVAEKLSKGSAGMFRWAQCQLDCLANLHTVKDVLAALDQLPQGLDETYDNILSNVAPQNAETVRRILVWLSFSVLPLTLQELWEAVAIDENLDHIDPDSRLHDPRDILTLCGSLLSMSPQGHVRLAHLSVKDYLLSTKISKKDHATYFAISPGEVKHELAIWCLTYLEMAEPSSGPVHSREDYLERLTTHPFLKHASICWSYYTRAAASTPALKTHVLSFFDASHRQAFMSWVQVLNAKNGQDWDVYPRHATSLYYAASFGLTDIVSEMIRTGVDLNAPGSRFGGTALHAAVLRNHISVIKILLEAGADATQPDFNKTTPLHTAAARAHTEAMLLLLKHGALKDAVDCNGETPLQWGINADRPTSRDILMGKVVVTGHVDEKVGEVWQSGTATYFPGFDAKRRSGIESSRVISVGKAD